jgi:hypothetical protein
MPPLHPIAPQTPAEKAAGQWTIASRVADALAVAESRFGPRDGTFRLLGYIFDGKIPRLGTDLAQKTLLLLLADYTEQDFNQAIYQLSHEVVHMLAPVGSGRPTYLEEGLATLFSEQYTHQATGLMYGSPIPSYTVARDAVRKFMADDQTMRALRAIQPTFSAVTPAMLKAANAGCADDVAILLCSTFQR